MLKQFQNCTAVEKGREDVVGCLKPHLLAGLDGGFFSTLALENFELQLFGAFIHQANEFISTRPQATGVESEYSNDQSDRGQETETVEPGCLIVMRLRSEEHTSEL